jgi:hypothetical protein
MPSPTETQVQNARRVLAADYFSDVRGAARYLAERLNQGEFGPGGEATREAFTEALDQFVDGHERVIYTGQAMDCLRYSDHDDAAIEELGVDGLDWSSGTPWSALAFFAFRADVLDHLGAFDVDIDAPQPSRHTRSPVGQKRG